MICVPVIAFDVTSDILRDEVVSHLFSWGKSILNVTVRGYFVKTLRRILHLNS